MQTENNSIEATGAGGSTGQSVVSGSAGQDTIVSRRDIRDMIMDSEAKQEVKFNQFIADVNLQLSKLDKMPTTPAIIGMGVTFLIAAFAILAFASDRFDGGIGLGISIGEKFSENTIKIERLENREEEANRIILEALNNVTDKLDDIGIEGTNEPKSQENLGQP
jgi:hypothetical protein